MPRLALWQLINKYGGDQTVRTFDDIERKFAQTRFFEAWDWVCSFLREPDDFTLLGREVWRASSRLVADLGRNLGPEGAMRALEQVAEVRGSGIIGVGLGGYEPQYAHELFEAVYERARWFGFRTSAHAGETAGRPSVWGAIQALRVDRIGHAVRAIEDPELVRYLAEQRISFELCLTANVRGGLVDSFTSHPVRRYFDLGIPISLNTDDPLFFANSLVDEFAAAQQFHHFTRGEVKSLIVSAIQSTWLPAEGKTRLLSEFRSETAWGETE